MSKLKKGACTAAVSVQASPSLAGEFEIPQPLATQQFGVSLQFIKDNNNGQVIPPIVRQCVDFLTTPDGTLYQFFLLKNKINKNKKTIKK